MIIIKWLDYKMCCLLIKKAKPCMPYPGISNYDQKGDNVYPGIDLYIFDFTKDLGCQEMS